MRQGLFQMAPYVFKTPPYIAYLSFFFKICPTFLPQTPTIFDTMFL